MQHLAFVLSIRTTPSSFVRSNVLCTRRRRWEIRDGCVSASEEISNSGMRNGELFFVLRTLLQ